MFGCIFLTTGLGAAALAAALRVQGKEALTISSERFAMGKGIPVNHR